ncbi:MAG: aminotransferase class V-fold PLP-dependent enzyme [Woeseiaceae bacterium]|nr:aminotransferase class V-fold PLP-dependent enzyme [Woeseiaceae bacterium]
MAITPDRFSPTPDFRELFTALISGNQGELLRELPSRRHRWRIANRRFGVKAHAGQSSGAGDSFCVACWMNGTRAGAEHELVTVRRPADDDWTAALLEHIDASTALAAVPNCHWTDGSLIDLVRIGGALRDVGAALVVDATQSLGAYPLNVADIKPDFLVAATYKWLLGPYSLGFLYAGEKHRSGKRIEHNWIRRSGSENFGGLVEYKSSFQPGARRYDMGERSNFALLPMALAAMRQILDWKCRSVAETIGELSRDEDPGVAARHCRDALGYVIHLVGLPVGGGDSADIARTPAADVYVGVHDPVARGAAPLQFVE